MHSVDRVITCEGNSSVRACCTVENVVIVWIYNSALNCNIRGNGLQSKQGKSVIRSAATQTHGGCNRTPSRRIHVFGSERACAIIQAGLGHCESRTNSTS